MKKVQVFNGKSRSGRVRLSLILAIVLLLQIMLPGVTAFATIYEYADAPAVSPDGTRRVESIDDLAGPPVRISAITDSKPRNTYWMKGNIITGTNTGTVIGRTNKNDSTGAETYYFERPDPAQDVFLLYRLDENDVKRYVQVTNTSGAAFVTSGGTPFSVTMVPGETAFYLEFQGAVNTNSPDGKYYLNLRKDDNGKGFSGTAQIYKTSKGSEIIVEYVEESQEVDRLGLDGKTFGILHDLSGRKTAELTAQQHADGVALAAASVDLTVNPYDTASMLIVPQEDLTDWTFTWVEGDNYYISTEVDGVTKFLTISYAEGTGANRYGTVTLTDTPGQDSLIHVTPGMGSNIGKYRLYCQNSDLALCLRGGSTDKGFYGFNDGGVNEWMHLAVPSEVSDVDFVSYCADKVSVSDTQRMPDGAEVIIYTRIWDEASKSYQFYAVDHDGTLRRVYDCGGTIRWVGSRVDTLVWDFTEYHYEGTNQPNYYYELQNKSSGLYLAPQISGGGQILTDHTVGINLNGRRYGDYTSSIAAWDDPRYDYAGLTVDGLALDTATMSQAPEFYFAVLSRSEAPLNEVETVDNNDYGITMRMVNFTGPTNTAGSRNLFQTEVLGAGTEIPADLKFPTTDIVTDDLDENGYPVATATGRSLEDLFGSAQEVNHLFLSSIYNESSYFEYDCTQSFAQLGDDNNFTVYNELGTIEVETRSQGHGQFMPFNKITPDRVSRYTNIKDVFNIPLESGYPRLNEQMYSIPRSQAQYFFGMDMSSSFVQSKDGKDAWGHDIIFEFAGDDDMWLYLDGIQILDLGGIHSALVGKINFATGDVQYPSSDTSDDNIAANAEHIQLRTIYRNHYLNHGYTEEEADALLDEIFVPGANEGEYVYRNYSAHDMRMFYMERGSGASNLHVRFNLTTTTPGQVRLHKDITGTDKQDYTGKRFAYQIWYLDETDGQYHTVSRSGDETTGFTYTGVKSVNYDGTLQPVEYVSLYKDQYPDVFLLSHNQTADIRFADDRVKYFVRECSVDTTIYDEVRANDVLLQPLVPDTQFADFQTEPAEVRDIKQVDFQNHADESALRALTITKQLFDAEGNLLTREQDPTGFRFRFYLGEDLDYYRMDSYHVKDPDGYYCYFDETAQTFVSTGERIFANLSPEQQLDATFTSSPSGAIDRIPSRFSVEIRGLLVDTRFKVEERAADIPKGYDLIGYERDDDSYIIDEGEQVNSGVIRDRSNPHLIVNNRRGWGLTVVKTWSDNDFMTSHDNIYFGVYQNGALVEGTLRQMRTEVTAEHPAAESSIYYFFEHLPDGGHFSDYDVREVMVTDPVVDADGYVTSCAAAEPVAEGGTLTVGGVPSQSGVHGEYAYISTYGEPVITGADDNVRTDNVSNDRPGVRIVKTDAAGKPLADAVFTVFDGVETKTYTSGADGFVVLAYPEQNVPYTITEIKTPDGYTTLVDTFTLTQVGGELVVTNGDGVVSVSDVTDAVVVSVKNVPTQFSAVKVDAQTGKPIRGVVFSLHAQVMGSNGPMKQYQPIEGYARLITGADGVIPQINGSLPAGTYYLVEEQTPNTHVPLGEDIVFTVDKTGHVLIESAPEGTTLASGENENGPVFTLQVRNQPQVRTISLTPQTLVADFGLDIHYNVKDNNTRVLPNSEYAFIGVADPSAYSETATKEPPAQMTKVGEACAGSFGNVTLAADGMADYRITTMSFTGEDTFCLVAHVTKIAGVGVDLYAYEMLTYIPATTVYYEEDFIESDAYVDGVEGTETAYGFGKWERVTAGEQQDSQAADLAGVVTANLYGYDPNYTEFATFSNASAEKVSVGSVNAANAGGAWPYVEFNFAGTGFDVISVTGCDTGMLYVRVYDAETNKQVKSMAVNTYYGYNYGRLYLDDAGQPTLDVTDIPLYEIPEGLDYDSGEVVTAGGKLFSTVPAYRDKSGALTTEDTGTPAYGESWLLNEASEDSLYQIPVIKIRDLAYGSYRARIEPRFTSIYGHYKMTDDGYKYFDLYVDAIRVYDPAGSGEDGSLTSKVIQDAYTKSAEMNEKFTTLKSVVIAAESMGVYDEDGKPCEGAVIVDGGQVLTTDRLSDYGRYGPINELYLGKGMSVAFEMWSSEIPADVQIQMRKISEANPTLKVTYCTADNSVITKEVTVNTATDLSYSILRMIGADSVNWTTQNEDVDRYYTSGLVVLTNTGEDESLLSVTNLKWTYANPGAHPVLAAVSGNKSVNGLIVDADNVASVPKIMAFSRLNTAVNAADPAATYEDGTITMTVTTSDDVQTLVVRDADGNVIDGEAFDRTFETLDDGTRLWTVTLEDCGEGVYDFLLSGEADGYTGKELRVCIVAEDPMPEPEPQEPTDPVDNSVGARFERFLARVRGWLMRLIELLRALMSILGIEVG